MRSSQKTLREGSLLFQRILIKIWEQNKGLFLYLVFVGFCLFMMFWGLHLMRPIPMSESEIAAEDAYIESLRDHVNILAYQYRQLEYQARFDGLIPYGRHDVPNLEKMRGYPGIKKGEK